MTPATHTTQPGPSGGWVYTLYLDESPVLTSGAFMLREDAEKCGRHFASDAPILQDFLKRQHDED